MLGIYIYKPWKQRPIYTIIVKWHLSIITSAPSTKRRPIYPESHHHVVTALKLSKETGDRRLTAVILNNLAYQQLKYLDQPAEAIRTYQECLAIFSEIGDLRGITYTSYDVSKAYLKVGLLDETWKYCLQSLNTAMTLDSTPLILHALHGFANLFAHVNDTERALRLCFLIANHPQVDPDTQMSG